MLNITEVPRAPRSVPRGMRAFWREKFQFGANRLGLGRRQSRACAHRAVLAAATVVEEQAKEIGLRESCSAICPYCKMGMPLTGDTHIRAFGEFMEAGTDDHYPCRAAKLRSLAQ